VKKKKKKKSIKEKKKKKGFQSPFNLSNTSLLCDWTLAISRSRKQKAEIIQNKKNKREQNHSDLILF